MPPDTLFEMVRRRPFEPFRLHVSDGATYDIRDPDMILPGQRVAVVGLPGDPARPFEGIVTVALLHVTRLEAIDAKVPKNGQ